MLLNGTIPGCLSRREGDRWAGTCCRWSTAWGGESMGTSEPGVGDLFLLDQIPSAVRSTTGVRTGNHNAVFR